MVPHRSPTNTSRWLHSRRHPILTEVKFLKQCLFLWLPSIPVPPKASYTDRSSFASNPCDHNGPTSEPKSPSTLSSTSYAGRSSFQSLRPQWFHIGAQLYWQKLLLILATIMVPHRSPTNTSRWLHSRRHPIPFPLTPFYSSLSQSILYWQKFLLIFVTTMVPHRSPTNTSRPLHSRPHPPAIFPSNAFSSGSLLCSSLSHSIVYWQKLLQILATTMIPHRSPTILTEIPSNPCDHDSPTSEPNKYK